MASLSTVLSQLRKHGNESRRNIYIRHGAAADAVYGVSVADLKKIAKTIKGDQGLAAELYATGNMDAMYLAGIIADGSKMARRELDAWAKAANVFSMIAEYTVPWVTVESAHARPLALKWIKSRSEHVAAAGWCTYSGIVAVWPDEQLDLDEIGGLLEKVEAEIHGAKNRVRYTMNGFVISVGTYVKPLLVRAKAVSRAIGAVEVDMGGTACKVPLASDYIGKVEKMGRVGTKRKTIRC